MVTYQKNIDSLNMPWTISPFFNSYLDELDLNEADYNMANDFNTKGYVVVDLQLSERYINSLKDKIRNLLNKNNLKTNSSFFSYNSSPRIVDAASSCDEVLDLALNEKVINILRLLYRKEPIPFSTINFLKGTEQPLHSDTIHFGSIPKGYLSACWVALEDTDEDNGALRVVEGSHKLKDIDYYDLNIKPARNMKMVEKIYRDYENYIVALLDELHMKEKIISMRKGTALIWSANLLHGGGIINKKHRTRWSQVTHYNFEGCHHYYHPFFSNPSQGKFVARDMEKLDLRRLA